MDFRATNYTLDTFVAPELSAFTAAEIPDMAGVAADTSHRLTNFILNSVVQAKLDRPDADYRFLLIRRAVLATEEYTLARERTLDYLSLLGDGGSNTTVTPYFRALHHWEGFLAQTMGAYNALVRPIPDQGARLFEPGDGSVYQRLNHLHNASKHSDKRIKAGQMPTSGPLAVWLYNGGLKSTEDSLTFSECAELATELDAVAYVFEDALSASERLREVRSRNPNPLGRLLAG
jgi:hypothetical protein